MLVGRNDLGPFPLTALNRIAGGEVQLGVGRERVLSDCDVSSFSPTMKQHLGIIAEEDSRKLMTPDVNLRQRE